MIFVETPAPKGRPERSRRAGFDSILLLTAARLNYSVVVSSFFPVGLRMVRGTESRKGVMVTDLQVDFQANEVYQ